jgi:hypothetical protein
MNRGLHTSFQFLLDGPGAIGAQGVAERVSRTALSLLFLSWLLVMAG